MAPSGSVGKNTSETLEGASMMVKFLLVFVFLILMQQDNGGSAAASEISNMSIVKTIQVESGDTFDCFLIDQQPTLSNPAFKHQKIQNPTILWNHESHQKMMNGDSDVQPSDIGCPTGTVPIQKMKEQTQPPFHFYDRRDHRNNSVAGFNYTVYDAGWSTDYGVRPFFGGRCSLGVWDVEITINQRSGAYLWVGDNDDSGYYEYIGVGWLVAPDLYGDIQPRLTASWSASGKTCVNGKCPGYVQLSQRVALGSTFENISKYKVVEYFLRVALLKDPQNANWYLYVGDEAVGYWHYEIFKSLSKSAAQVSTGGVTNSPRGQPSPPMGNGQFPNRLIEGWSSTIRGIMTAGPGHTLENPVKWFGNKFTVPRNCYQAGRIYDRDDHGVLFLYGGPGGC